MLSHTLQGSPPATTSSDVLIVSARMEHLKTLMRVMGRLSTRVFAAFTLQQAQQALYRQSFGLVFCDDTLAGGSYRELLSLRAERDTPKFVLLLRSGEWRECVEAMEQGAFDVLRCPLQPAEVNDVLLRAITNPSAQRTTLPIAPTAAPTTSEGQSQGEPAGVASEGHGELDELLRRAAQLERYCGPPKLVPPKAAAATATADSPLKKIS